MNPTHKSMVPCPYFLQSNCRFSEEACRSVYCIAILLSCHELQNKSLKIQCFWKCLQWGQQQERSPWSKYNFFLSCFLNNVDNYLFFTWSLMFNIQGFVPHFSFRYSHGFLVSVEDLMPFKEPDFRWTIIINNLSKFQLHCWKCTSSISTFT